MTIEEAQYEYYHAGGQQGKRKILQGAERVSTFTAIPTIDFSNILSSDPEVRKELAAKVRDACSNVGFFYAQNHPVPEEVISKTFKAIADFFALPKEEKMEVHIQKNPAIRGYEPPFETKLDIKTKGDYKEAFSIGDDPLDPEQNFPGTPPTNFVPQNLWPSSAPWLRETLYEYYSHVFPFAKQLTAIFALALDLPEDYFDHMFTFPITGLRSLHYPPQDTGGEVGLGAHSDYSWFTLVLQDSVEALEVLNANGEYVTAPPKERTLVVNTGEFLQTQTSGLFPATVHRVRNMTGRRRYSLPFFWTPDPEAVLDVIDSCKNRPGGNRKSEIVGERYVTRLFAARYQHPIVKKYAGVAPKDFKYDFLRT